MNVLRGLVLCVLVVTVAACGSDTWTATSAQGSGTIVVTQRTATRVVGTFQFIMPPAPGSGSTATRTATNGQFDVTF